MYQKEIETMGGVNEADDQTGKVEVSAPDGWTCVELTVTDGDDGKVTVYLDYLQLTSLIFALAGAGDQL